MDPYDYAMQLEKDGEAYYREIAAKSRNTGLKRILTMLADAEVEHYRIFQRMKAKETVERRDTTIIQGVKNIFARMRDEGESSGVDIAEIELYKKAQDYEKKTENFYRETADKVTVPGQKDIFLKIADEEVKHYYILQSIIDFVSRPDSWLLTAEWYHLEPY